jgi:septal ring factor EnvC (AmiA/AmiB activator)
VELGQVFSGYFSFHCEYSFRQMLHSSRLSSGAHTVGQLHPTYQGTRSHHTLRIKESSTDFLSRIQSTSIHYNNIISVFQKEIQQLVNTPSRDTTSESYIVTDGRALQAEISNLQKQLKMSKNEADKLREQLSNRCTVAITLRVQKCFIPRTIVHPSHLLMLTVITNESLFLLT